MIPSSSAHLTRVESFDQFLACTPCRIILHRSNTVSWNLGGEKKKDPLSDDGVQTLSFSLLHKEPPHALDWAIKEAVTCCFLYTSSHRLHPYPYFISQYNSMYSNGCPILYIYHIFSLPLLLSPIFLDSFPSSLFTSCCHYQCPPCFCARVYVCGLHFISRCLHTYCTGLFVSIIECPRSRQASSQPHIPVVYVVFRADPLPPNSSHLSFLFCFSCSVCSGAISPLPFSHFPLC